jgi:capsule polysaccharide export protein KpsE/RkpR
MTKANTKVVGFVVTEIISMGPDPNPTMEDLEREARYTRWRKRVRGAQDRLSELLNIAGTSLDPADDEAVAKAARELRAVQETLADVLDGVRE